MSKKYLKFITIFILMLNLGGCVSMIPKKDLDNWALNNGYILAKDVPQVTVPERQPLPHPEVPVIQIKDENGNNIPITQQYLMKIIISLFGTVEKFQYLVEIYEREYLNAGGKIMPDMTLEQLKNLYLQRIDQLDKATPKTSSPSVPGTTGATAELDMTVEDFATLVDLYNQFQLTGQSGD